MDAIAKKQEVESLVDLRVRLDPQCLSWDLYLFGDVSPMKMAELIQHMVVLDSTNEKRAINLMICSRGGDCGAGYALIDMMTSIRHPVRTIVLGEADSMASLIFIAGTPGMRFIGSRSMILFHPMSDMVADYSPYIQDRIKSHNLSNQFSEDLMKGRTALTKEQIYKANNGELWLGPGEAVQYKVADQIITDNEVITQMYSEITKQRAKYTPPKKNKKK